MKKIQLSILFVLLTALGFCQTVPFRQIQKAAGAGYGVISDGTGALSYVLDNKQSASTSVSSYTLTGTGTPLMNFSVTGKILSPITNLATAINQTFTSQSVTHNANGVTYFGVKSDGTLTQQSTRFTTEQKYNHLCEWAVVYDPVTPFNIIAFNSFPNTTNQIGQQLHNFMKNIGVRNLSGNQYSAFGTTILNIQKESGIVEGVGWGDLDSDNPNEKTMAAIGSAITFNVRISTGDYLTGQTVINPTIYENPLGTVATVPNPTDVTVYRLSFFQSNLTRVQIGQTIYSNIDVAVANTIARTDAYATEANIADNGITVTYLAIQKNCTAWSQTTRYRFFPSPSSSSSAATSLSTLQSSYLNSTAPQIVVNDTKGSFQIQSARSVNTTSIFEGLNIAGTTTYSLTGNGDVTSLSTTNTSATASTVPYYDSNKKLVSSTVTPTELGYVSGVTSPIQGQLVKSVIQITSAGFNPADNSFYYFRINPGTPISSGVAIVPTVRFKAVTTTTSFKIDGYISNTTAGTSEAITIKLFNNTAGTNTTLTSTLTADAVFNSFTFTGNFTITAGDEIYVEMMTPAWVTNPTGFIPQLNFMFK